jgi:16S rRNA (guanine1516-N2)-methyltransferase
MQVSCYSLLNSTIKIPEADVVYLDPMFPERQKSALVKKDMRFFHSVVGDDSDADQLLQAALLIDCARAVVKRPIKAPLLANVKPSHQILGKSIRYDVYVKRKLV